MSPSEYRDDPAYAEGFYDAKVGEPLFDDAHPAYKAGWEAFHRAKDMLVAAGFAPKPDGSYSKTTVVAPTPRGEG